MDFQLFTRAGNQLNDGETRVWNRPDSVPESEQRLWNAIFSVPESVRLAIVFAVRWQTINAHEQTTMAHNLASAQLDGLGHFAPIVCWTPIHVANKRVFNLVSWCLRQTVCRGTEANRRRPLPDGG